MRVLLNYLERVDRKLLDVANQVSLFGRERVSAAYVSNICSFIIAQTTHITHTTFAIHYIPHANQVLEDCERKQRTKDSNYDTLADAISKRLRDSIGENHWTNACRIQKQMIVIRQKKKLRAFQGAAQSSQSKRHSQHWMISEAIEAAETISFMSQGSQSPFEK